MKVKMVRVAAGLAIICAGFFSGVAPTVSAAPVVIEDAVVVLRLPCAETYDGGGVDEDAYANYRDINQSWCGNDGYRLPSTGRAQYIAGFGGGNSSALIGSDGGCAIKSGSSAVWCFGQNAIDGDGTRRSQPLPKPVAGLSATQLTFLDFNSGWSGHFDPDTEEDPLTFESNVSVKAFCALTTTDAIKCWGRNGSVRMEGPTLFATDPVESISASGAILSDGTVLGWGPSFAEDGDDLVLHQLGTLPDSLNLSGVQAFPTFDTSVAFYTNTSFPPADPYVSQHANVLGMLLNSGDSNFVLSGWPLPLPGTKPVGDYPGSEPTWLSRLDSADFSDAFASDREVALDSLDVPGVPVNMGSRWRPCFQDEYAISCLEWPGYVQDDIHGSVGDDEGWVYWVQYRETRLGDATEPYFNLPETSNVGINQVVATRHWACAIQNSGQLMCAPVDWYSKPGIDADPWERETDLFVRRDFNNDGYMSVGPELPINCGVGFQCDFDAESVRIVGDYVTAVGTLTRTPRTSVSVRGSVTYDDGTVVTGGTVTWRSSEGLLSSSTEISPTGTFALPARTGDGNIEFNTGNMIYNRSGCPSSGVVNSLVQSACVTQLTSASIGVSLTGSVTGALVELPTIPGEVRRIHLQFGDGETGMAGVAISGHATGTCTVTTVVGLGGLYACADYGLDQYEDFELKTGSDGVAEIWMPTELDVELILSMTEDDGITWSDVIDSFYDDGVSPTPYQFPGLVVAVGPETLSVESGSSLSVEGLLLQDGIDPAFGLSAELVDMSSLTSPAGFSSPSIVGRQSLLLLDGVMRPFTPGPSDGLFGTMATGCGAQDVIDESDETGAVEFIVCPARSGVWRIVSTDGAFFPSAPIEIEVRSTAMVAAISLQGALLDQPFDSDKFEYSGYFTAKRVKFSVTKTPSASGAKIKTTRCARPSSGTRVCSVTVSLAGDTDVYSFNLRRNP